MLYRNATSAAIDFQTDRGACSLDNHICLCYSCSEGGVRVCEVMCDHRVGSEKHRHAYTAYKVTGTIGHDGALCDCAHSGTGRWQVVCAAKPGSSSSTATYQASSQSYAEIYL